MEKTSKFENYEITESDKQRLIIAETVIRKNLDIVKKAELKTRYEICKNLYEASLIFKTEGNWMDWYTSIGLDKDKVSTYLKRCSLYMELYDGRDWVTGLSDKAVRILTGKKVPAELVYQAWENNLVKIEDIKNFLQENIKTSSDVDNSSSDAQEEKESTESPSDPLEAEFFKGIESFEETKKIITCCTSFPELKKQMRIAADLKRRAAEIEKLAQARMDALAQENNMKIFE